MRGKSASLADHAYSQGFPSARSFNSLLRDISILPTSDGRRGKFFGGKSRKELARKRLLSYFMDSQFNE